MASFNLQDLSNLYGGTQPDLSDPHVARLAMNLLMQHQQQQSQALMQEQSMYEQLLALGIPPENLPAQLGTDLSTNHRSTTILPLSRRSSRGAPSNTPYPYPNALPIPSPGQHHHNVNSPPNPPGFTVSHSNPWAGSSLPDAALASSNYRMMNYSTESLPDVSLDHSISPPPPFQSNAAFDTKAREPGPPPPRSKRALTLPSQSTTDESSASSSRLKKQSSSAGWLPEELVGRKPAAPPATTAEEKRKRNTEASTRFRLKKKIKTVNMQRVVADLSGRAAELEKEAEELRRENGWLKEIVALKGGSETSESPPYIDEYPYRGDS